MSLNSNDVANYIIAKEGAMPAMKLHKLVYYCQAWHLVWADKPLFKEAIEARPEGPVVPALYDLHGKTYKIEGKIESSNSSNNAIAKDSAHTIDLVLAAYSKYTTFELLDMIRKEAPYTIAREGLSDESAYSNEISYADMAEYYAGRSDSKVRQVA